MNKKHGLSRTRLYKIWNGMKGRCNNKKDKDYKRYGLRGIKICDEWLYDFKKFHDWSILNGYKDTLTIDRKDVNGNYEPSNCRWATPKQQCNNRRSNLIFEYKGKKDTMANLARKYNISYHLLNDRLNSGWPIDRAIRNPAGKPYKGNNMLLRFNGIIKTASEWSKELGGNESLVRHRLERGWSIKRALTTQTKRRSIND